MSRSVPTSATLAPTVWSFSGNHTARDVVLVLAGTALIAIAAKIKVPFLPVPMTLQTLAIALIAATYGFRLGTVTVLAYLAQGLVGIPVFTNTPPAVAGPLYFLGPTGGFLIGFVVMAMIIGYAADRGWDRSSVRLFAAMVAGEIIMMGLGFVWLAWFATLSNGTTGLGAEMAFAAGVSPFVLAEILKIALASLLVPLAWSLLQKREI